MPLRADQLLYLLLILSLPIVWPFSIKFQGMDIPATDFIFVAAAAAWFLAFVRGKTDFRRSPLYLPLALYLAALVLATVFSESPRSSAVKLAGEVYLMGLAVLTFNQVTSLPALRLLTKTWAPGLAATILASLAGAALFYYGGPNPTLFDYGSFPEGNYPRTRGLFLNANMLCNYLSVSFSLLLIQRSLGWGRWFWPLCLGLWVTALLTLSPGVGGLMLSAGLWGWLYLARAGRLRLARLTLACGCLAAALFFAGTTFRPFAYAGRGFTVPPLEGRFEPSSRALAWQTSLQTFMRHPLLGRGVGAEVAAAAHVLPSGMSQVLTDAHNSWLSIAGQEGGVGLLAFAGFVFLLLKGCFPLRLGETPGVLVRTGLCIAVMDAFLYHSLSGSFEDARHIWVLFGLLMAAKETLPAEGARP